jgi:hypothetical protein
MHEVASEHSETEVEVRAQLLHSKPSTHQVYGRMASDSG